MVAPVQVAVTLLAEAGEQAAQAAVSVSSSSPKVIASDRAAVRTGIVNAGRAARLVKTRSDTRVAFNSVIAVVIFLAFDGEM